MPNSISPREAYVERLATEEVLLKRLRARDAALGLLRVVVFFVGFCGTILAYSSYGLLGGVAVVAATALLFFIFVFFNDRAVRALKKSELAVAFFQCGLARLEDRWMGSGSDGAGFADPNHPFAADVDLFGPSSLFQLLNTARTHDGEETLARWLSAPAPIAEVRARQAALPELREMLDWRVELASLGSHVSETLESKRVSEWGAAPCWKPSIALVGFAWLMTLIGVASLVAAWWLGHSPVVLLLIFNGLVAFALRQRIHSVIEGIKKPARELAVLAEILSHIERANFQSPRLKEIQAQLDTGGVPASARIARLARMVQWLDARYNQFFAPFAILFLWSLHFSFAIERWRAISDASISRWIAAIGEMEALSALATYAHEHPDDAMPEIVEGAPRFDATALGHPLLKATACVRNDVRLGGDVKMLLVSGSNMSGKSTMLRSIGTSIAMALAGAPVRAGKLTLTPLAVGATLRVQDSLQTGTSRFYAEISRLRQVMDLTEGRLPLLFLLDEILHGTNSHDRVLGAEALIKGLLAKGAIGLVTTHDLTLARIADVAGLGAVNVHFEDHIENGKLVFDYRMRPGVIQKSNALALMRMVGLEV